MVKYKTIIKQFEEQGEKTGWTYIDIPSDIAASLNPAVKKSYRVKGLLNKLKINAIAILPMGDGVFIMPLNAAMRKGIAKGRGAIIEVALSIDKNPLPISAELLTCLEEDEVAKKFFESLAPGNQRYFSNWIESNKTENTKANRIAASIAGLQRKMSYGEIIRELKQQKR